MEWLELAKTFGPWVAIAFILVISQRVDTHAREKRDAEERAAVARRLSEVENRHHDTLTTVVKDNTVALTQSATALTQNSATLAGFAETIKLCRK